MQKYMVIGLIVIFGLLYIFYIPNQPFLLKTVFQMIPMLLIMTLAFLQQVPEKESYRKWLLLGLFFCMIGDATLHWLFIGLASLLIGHICYIVAFLQVKRKVINTLLEIFLLAYGVVMAAWILGNIFRAGNFVLGTTMGAYIAAILTMGWAAIQTGSKLAVLGSSAFILSDSVLSVNHFIADIPSSNALMMTSYYGAQLLLTLSVANYSVIQTKVLK